jgi:nucleolar complex protein 3
MAAGDPELRDMACAVVRQLLASQETAGKVALEALQLVADLVKRRKCVLPSGESYLPRCRCRCSWWLTW